MIEVTKGADMEGSIKQMLENGGCERNVIAEIGSALINGMELATNGRWENFYSEEIQRGVTTLLATRQQPSLDDHLTVQHVDLTADKKDGKSKTSSLTDSPKTGKPKAATEKSVGDDSAQNALADSMTLSVTGALNSEEASRDTAEQCATMGSHRTVGQNNLRQGQGDASTVANSDGSLSYTQAPNIDVASGNTEQTVSTGTE
jgi:hypothetical protein